MLVLTRHRVAPDQAADFLDRAATALAALAARPGFLDGTVARAVDDGGLHVLCTRWDSVGSYRRALGSFEVKTAAVPLLSTALDEPSAFEPLLSDGPGGPQAFTTDRADDADDAAPGRRSGL